MIRDKKCIKKDKKAEGIFHSLPLLKDAEGKS